MRWSEVHAHRRMFQARVTPPYLRQVALKQGSTTNAQTVI